MITFAKVYSEDIDSGNVGIGNAGSKEHVLNSNIDYSNESPSEQAATMSSSNIFRPDYVSDVFVVHVLVYLMSHQYAPL